MATCAQIQSAFKSKTLTNKSKNNSFWLVKYWLVLNIKLNVIVDISSFNPLNTYYKHGQNIWEKLQFSCEVAHYGKISISVFNFWDEDWALVIVPWSFDIIMTFLIS